MDRGAWWATVHGVTKSRTRLSTHRHTQSVTIQLCRDLLIELFKFSGQFETRIPPVQVQWLKRPWVGLLFHLWTVALGGQVQLWLQFPCSKFGLCFVQSVHF